MGTNTVHHLLPQARQSPHSNLSKLTIYTYLIVAGELCHSCGVFIMYCMCKTFVLRMYLPHMYYIMVHVKDIYLYCTCSSTHVIHM